MLVKIIFILALLATLITSWSLIEPPGWTIIFTPASINDFIPSAKGKNASEAAMEFFILFFENFFAFRTAILQLSSRLGCPAPIPIVEKLLVKTIAFDLTYLEILNANSISFSSLLVGLFLVTNFRFFLLKTISSLSWIKNELLKVFKVVLFFGLYFEISIILRFFLLFNISKAFFSNPFARITSIKFLFISVAII